MSRIFKLAGTIFLAAVFCLTFVLDGVASAATSYSSDKVAQRKAMRMFRESLFATANDYDNIFHQFFIFLLPDFQCELDFNGKITGHSLDAAGEFELYLRGNDGKLVDVEVPFYLQQQGDKMVFYYQQENKNWVKDSMPFPVAALTDLIVSPTKQEIEKEMSMVKDVILLQDNDSRRTFLVQLDGNKLADEVKLQMKSDTLKFDGKSDPAADKFFNQILGYIDTGLRNANVWYTWKIDKKNHKTGTVVVDLSQVVQEVAFAALNDPDGIFIDEIREILETLAFYSEFKSYTTLLGPEAQTTLIVPQEIINTAVEDNNPSLDKIDQQ